MFTQAQHELQAHIEAMTAKGEAEAKACGGMYLGPVSDPAHWAECNVYSIDQFERYMLISELSDAYKEAFGSRPRHFNYNEMTTEDLQKEVDNCWDYAARNQAFEEECEQLAEADRKEKARASNAEFKQASNPFALAFAKAQAEE